MACSVCGAEKVYALGLCNKHYRKHNRYGDANFKRVYTIRPIVDRFLEKVDKSGHCWIWTGGKSHAGYGHIQEGGQGSKSLLAHRVSYAIHKGAVPYGMYVLHSCDNPSCVNPEHLRCGTNSENMQDAYDKHRKVSPFVKKENRHQGERSGSKGAANANSRLTESDIRAIRASTEKPGKVAKVYNIIPEYVTKIRQRKAWAHVE